MRWLKIGLLQAAARGLRALAPRANVSLGRGVRFTRRLQVFFAAAPRVP